MSRPQKRPSRQRHAGTRVATVALLLEPLTRPPRLCQSPPPSRCGQSPLRAPSSYRAVYLHFNSACLLLRQRLYLLRVIKYHLDASDKQNQPRGTHRLS